MAIQIRFMSWNIENYGTNKHTSSTALPRLIADTMLHLQVDVLAIIEMQNNGFNVILPAILAELGNIGYQNNWLANYNKVGDEGVAFIWHEAGHGNANAFRAVRDGNNFPISAMITKNNAGNPIYFPKTRTSWASVLNNGRPDGRRPAFFAFETDEGINPRRVFTCSNIHTPFSSSLIQAWAARQYATAESIVAVPTINGFQTIMATAFRNNAIALITTALQTPANGNQAGVAGNENAIATDIVIDTTNEVLTNTRLWAYLLSNQYDSATVALLSAAAASAIRSIERFVSLSNSILDTKMAVTVSAALVASEIITTFAIAASNATAVEHQCQARYGNLTRNKGKNRISSEATAQANASLTAVGFPPAPANNPVNAAMLAGDFNIDYPDNNVYLPAVTTALGGNAYTGLETVGTVGITNQLTTQIGNTNNQVRFAFIYQVKNPLTIQHTDNTDPTTYVPQNVYDVINALPVATEYIGPAELTQAIYAEGQNQPTPVTQSEIDPYINQIAGTFDTRPYNGTVDYLDLYNNNTNYFRVNAYDNIFYVNLAFNNFFYVDMLSYLGNWPADTGGGNLYAAATANLHATANNFLAALPTWPTDVNGDNHRLDTAAGATQFYKKYMSDHYPVIIDVTI